MEHVLSAMETRLYVDGKEIGLNEFVNSILGGTVAGAVESLRGVGVNWKKIVIEIEK
jgi:hypothetical protein